MPGCHTTQVMQFTSRSTHTTSMIGFEHLLLWSIYQETQIACFYSSLQILWKKKWQKKEQKTVVIR